MDSMEMELAGSESMENGVSNPVPTPPSTKKAIILPILGKKKNLVTPTLAAATATAVPSPSSTSGPTVVALSTDPAPLIISKNFRFRILWS